MKQKSKPAFPIFLIIVLLLICGVTGYLVFRNFFDYFYEHTVLNNKPTIFFRCNEFATQTELQQILKKNSGEVLELKAYISQINGGIMISEVGERCLNQFQFEVTFNTGQQRLEIERILRDQRLEGKPVFLRNL